MQRSNVDYNQFIYQDPNGEIRVKTTLMKLLALTNNENKEKKENKGNMLLDAFVKATQPIWLRNPKLNSRWDQTESDLNQELIANIKKYLNELGLLQTPKLRGQ